MTLHRLFPIICRHTLSKSLILQPYIRKHGPKMHVDMMHQKLSTKLYIPGPSLGALHQQRGLSTTEETSLEKIKDILTAENCPSGSRNVAFAASISDIDVHPSVSDAANSGQTVSRKQHKTRKQDDWERLRVLVEGMLAGDIEPSFSCWTEVDDHFTRTQKQSGGHWSTRLMKVLANIVHSQEVRRLAPKCLNIGQSLLNFARVMDANHKDGQQGVTLAMLCYFIKVLGGEMIARDFEDPETEALICQVYGELCDRTPVLDGEGSAAVIQGLAATSTLWSRSVELIDDVRLTGPPGPLHYSPVIGGAIRLGHINEAWAMMEEMVAETSDQESAPVPSDDVFTAILDRAEQHGEHELVTRLLSSMHDYYWVPSEAVARQFMRWCERIPAETWAASVTKVTQRGQCMHCGKQMASEKITPEQFAELRKDFLEKSLKREDIFLNTTPKELQRFHQFLNTQPPFDMVLDGLNIALQLSYNYKKNAAQQLVQVVEEMAGRGKQRLLVLAKRHVRKQWAKHHLDKIHSLAKVFYTEDISEDDPFMLYAAFHSGPDCRVVTRDMLRDHRFLLQPEMRTRFKSWQRTNQVMFSKDQKSRKPSFQWPKDFATRVQHSPNSWHIPYEDGVERSSHEVPNAWVCLQNKPKQ